MGPKTFSITLVLQLPQYKPLTYMTSSLILYFENLWKMAPPYVLIFAQR